MIEQPRDLVEHAVDGAAYIVDRIGGRGYGQARSQVAINNCCDRSVNVGDSFRIACSEKIAGRDRRQNGRNDSEYHALAKQFSQRIQFFQTAPKHNLAAACACARDKNGRRSFAGIGDGGQIGCNVISFAVRRNRGLYADVAIEQFSIRAINRSKVDTTVIMRQAQLHSALQTFFTFSGSEFGFVLERRLDAIDARTGDLRVNQTKHAANQNCDRQCEKRCKAKRRRAKKINVRHGT
ncbi:MAG: hypothetical protein KGL46_04790 [Hyphomicrobiales bacterium]|nr:hypothetical protein [Hyphomicrobiales bacterium]